jgi:hypothetical protein
MAGLSCRLQLSIAAVPISHTVVRPSNNEAKREQGAAASIIVLEKPKSIVFDKHTQCCFAATTDFRSVQTQTTVLEKKVSTGKL